MRASRASVPGLQETQIATGTRERASCWTWASAPDQCKVPQDTPGAPLIIETARYDQHEAHCEFTTVTGSEPEWKISAECTVEGSAQPLEFTLKVSGEALTMTDDTGARDLVRCK